MAPVSSALARTLTLERLGTDSVTWRLLRADNAPLIAGILGARLGGEERRLAAPELYERIDADLDELRGHSLDLPQTAQAYCAAWRSAGFLIRRPSDEARGETLELSAGALSAIRTLDSLAEPRQSVTESRLASIAAQLGQLALDTDPDASRRLEQLIGQRNDIDAEIERIHSGDFATLDPARSIERVRDILSLAEEMPSDFARVRAEFEQLNRVLRERIIESDDSQRAVLDEIFRGVDLIADSDEGRSFAGFSALVLDPALGASFDDHIDRILDRDFAGGIPAPQRRFLRRFITTLKRDSGEIHDVVTSFARGLRRYVQSQDYQRDRVLRDLLRTALARAVPAAAHTRPYSDTTLRLPLTAVQLASIGSLRLHNPGELDASTPVSDNTALTVDLEALRALARDTEIDFDELTANTNALLRDGDTCTIGDVLTRFPATQGVASVVGLIALGAAQGVADDAGETVHWVGADGIRRAADIPLYRFTGRLS